MNADQVRTTALGFLVAAVLLGGLAYLVGVEGLLDTVADADGELVALVVAATLGWLAAWGYGLRVVLGVLGADLSYARSFLVMCGAMFSNNVTPLGQAGGEPVSALLISSVADTEYERGLAAIASVDSLNFVPSVVLALVGAGYYAADGVFGTRLRMATVGILAVAVAVPALAYLAWTRRQTAQQRVVGLLAPLVVRVAGVVPGVTAPTRDSVAERVGGFVGSIERVAASPSGVARALGASAVGWLFQMAALWLAFQAVGSPVPFAVPLFAVPVGALAGVTPSPGGVGGIEVVLVALLSAIPGAAVGPETALAAVVVFRGSVYWMPVLIGGPVAADVGVDTA